MALAITKFQVVGKSDPSKKTKKIKYSGFGCTKKLNLNELQKDVTLLEHWTERDFDVQLGTVLMAELEVMGDSVMVTRLMTIEEYAAAEY